MIVYVGETEMTLYQRQVLNLSATKGANNDLVAMHFHTNEQTVCEYCVLS